MGDDIDYGGHDGTGYMDVGAASSAYVRTFREAPEECYTSTEALLDFLSEVMSSNDVRNKLDAPPRLMRYWVSLYEDRPIYIAGKRGPNTKTYRDALVFLGPSDQHIRDKWFKVEIDSRFIIHPIDGSFDHSIKQFFEQLKPYLCGAVASLIHFQENYTNEATILEELYFELEADAVAFAMRRDGHDEAV